MTSIRLRKYRILELAEERGFKNQKQFAEELGMQQASLSQLLKNNTNFTKETLEKLMSCLQCDLNDLVEKKID